MTPFFNYVFALIMLFGMGIFIWVEYGDDVLATAFPAREQAQLYIGGSPIDVTVADTDEERRQGLSGTLELKPYTGMLFIFDYSSKWGIWMKDMNYPLDIIWVNDERRVVYIEEEVQPYTYPDVFAPDENALYVVEVPAGTVNDLQIKIGDRMDLPLNYR